MGNLLSSSARKYQLLIGDLTDDLPPEEVKLYHLSQYILDKDNSYVGTVCRSLGCKVVDKDDNTQADNETGNNNSQSGKDGSLIEVSTNVNSIEHIKDDVTLLTDVTKDQVSSLFTLYITKKPYFFSQTFSQWRTIYKYSLLCPPVCTRADKRKIYIQPVDNFPSFITDFEIDLEHFSGSHDFFSLLQKFMEAYFDEMTVSILPKVNLLDSKWNVKTRFHHKTGSKQYFVQDFFPKLKKVKPSDGYCIMGVSWTDLYPTEQLNFVLGEAHFIFKSGIFCFGRCEPKTYDPDTFKDITEMDVNLLWRILKVISHETCHLFGLQHCWYFRCTMNESNSMAEAASQPLFLCPVCLRKLQHACGFRVLHRYRRLLCIMADISKAFPSQKFVHSVRWLEKCIEYLETEN